MSHKDKLNEKDEIIYNRIDLHDRYGALIRHIIVCLLTIIVLIMVVIALAAFVCSLQGTPNQGSAEETLLSSGIGIIGLAIATWAGLNISNSIDRKDIDELRQTLHNNIKPTFDKVEKEMKSLEEKTKNEISPFIKQSRPVLLYQFLVELERAQYDPIARYFAEQFQRITANTMDISYVKLITIETLISQVVLRHKSDYSYDEILINQADKGLERINQIKGEKQDRTIQTSIRTQINKYLVYSKARLEFYKGYCDKDRGKSAKNFLDAIATLNNGSDFGLFEDEFGSNNKQARACWNNMIGESYSKIVHFYTDVCNNTDHSDEKRAIERLVSNIKEIASEAIKYCEKAVNLISTSTYHRDLGCAYERKDRVTEFLEGKKYESSVNVIESYLKSVSCILNDCTINDTTKRNAFYVLLAYYHRYLGYRFSNGSDKGLVYEECKEHISNMYAYAYIAKLELPRCLVFQKLYAFSCYYVYKALKSKIDINTVSEKSCEYFRQQIQDAMDLLTQIDSDDGKKDLYTKKLREILEEITQS